MRNLRVCVGYVSTGRYNMRSIAGMCFATRAWCKLPRPLKSVRCAKRACRKSRSSACTFDLT